MKMDAQKAGDLRATDSAVGHVNSLPTSSFTAINRSSPAKRQPSALVSHYELSEATTSLNATQGRIHNHTVADYLGLGYETEHSRFGRTVFPPTPMPSFPETNLMKRKRASAEVAFTSTNMRDGDVPQTPENHIGAFNNMCLKDLAQPHMASFGSPLEDTIAVNCASTQDSKTNCGYFASTPSMNITPQQTGHNVYSSLNGTVYQCTGTTSNFGASTMDLPSTKQGFWGYPDQAMSICDEGLHCSNNSANDVSLATVSKTGHISSKGVLVDAVSLIAPPKQARFSSGIASAQGILCKSHPDSALLPPALPVDVEVDEGAIDDIFSAIDLDNIDNDHYVTQDLAQDAELKYQNHVPDEAGSDGHTLHGGLEDDDLLTLTSQMVTNGTEDYQQSERCVDITFQDSQVQATHCTPQLVSSNSTFEAMNPQLPAILLAGSLSQNNGRCHRTTHVADLQPIVRGAFPLPTRDRSPVIGLTSDALLRTCFRIGEAINVGRAAAKKSQNVIIELYAQVLSSQRDDSKQYFVFCDLYHTRPPYINAIYDASIWKAVELFNYDSGRLLQEGRTCRCMGTMKRSSKGWELVVLNIWEATWEDIWWVEGTINS